MKRIATSFCFLLVFVLSIQAQQALWQGPEIVSPEIHPDNTVTFRLFAPNAALVELSGDFITDEMLNNSDPGNRNIKMEKGNDGLWTYTTPSPLTPELYSYSMIVDGLRINDPSNVYLNRDIATLSNYFIISGDYADLYKVRNVPHGSVIKQWYDSPTLGTKRRVSIYTPPGYEKGDREYPVLYLLHGMGGDEEAWLSLGRADRIMDNLIAEGRAEPMIVVMTNGNVDQTAAPGESDLGLYTPTTRLPHTMDGSFETAFPDIVNFVEENYRVKKEKGSRAIAGLSMGGFHSMQISKEYPELFDYVGLFSAAVDRGDKSIPMYNNVEEKLAVQFANAPRLYWIGIGKDDFLFDENVAYRKLLDSKRYPYEYVQTPDGHIWKNWRIYLSEFVPRLFK